MCSNTSREEVPAQSYQLPQFFPFPVSAKESDGGISLPGSLYLTFKYEMAKHDLIEAFQWMQSHRHLDFVGFPPFCLQFLCHNILLTLLGPVTFQHHITAQRANSIRKRHKEWRIISLCSHKISLCGKAKRRTESPLLPSETTASTGREPEIPHVNPHLTACKTWVRTYSELLTKTQKWRRLLEPYKRAEEGGVINKGTMEETSVAHPFSSFQALPLQELLDIHPLRT